MNRVFEYALKVFLVLGAIFYCPVRGPISTDQAVWLGYRFQENFFVFGSFALFAVSVMATPKRRLSNWTIPLFCLFVLGTSLLFGFGGDLRRKTINVFMGLLFYKVVFENFDFLKTKSFAWWFGGLLVLNLFMCVLQNLGLDNVQTNTSPLILVGPGDKLMGFMRLKAHLGLLAAVFSVFLAQFSPLFLLAVVPLLYFGKVSASVLAVLIGFSIWGWFRLKKWQFFSILSVLLGLGVCYVLFYDMPGGQFGERFKVWHMAFGHVMRMSPILGEGIGSFALTRFETPQIAPFPPLWWSWAHNDIFQVFFETGVVGFSILTAYIVGRFKEFEVLRSDKVLQTLGATLVILLVIAFFNFPFHLGRFVHLFIFFFAIFHARVDSLKKGLLS